MAVNSATTPRCGTFARADRFRDFTVGSFLLQDRDRPPATHPKAAVTDTSVWPGAASKRSRVGGFSALASQAVERHPLVVFPHFDLHDGVDLPERPARL